MSSKNSNRSVPVSPPCVFHMGMINTVWKSTDKFYIVHTLIPKVRRIVVESKTLMALRQVLSALAISKAISVGCTPRANILLRTLEELDKPFAKSACPYPKMLGLLVEMYNRMPYTRPGKTIYHRRKSSFFFLAGLALIKYGKLLQSLPIFGLSFANFPLPSHTSEEGWTHVFHRSNRKPPVRLSDWKLQCS